MHLPRPLIPLIAFFLLVTFSCTPADRSLVEFVDSSSVMNVSTFGTFTVVGRPDPATFGFPFHFSRTLTPEERTWFRDWLAKRKLTMAHVESPHERLDFEEIYTHLLDLKKSLEPTSLAFGKDIRLQKSAMEAHAGLVISLSDTYNDSALFLIGVDCTSSPYNDCYPPQNVQVNRSQSITFYSGGAKFNLELLSSSPESALFSLHKWT